MLVIFEGVDGSGKTTVIKKLKEKFGWEEIIWPGKQKNPTEFIKMVKKFTEDHVVEINDNKVYLMDRGGVGEIIYGTLENRLGSTTPIAYKPLVDLWKSCVFVWCYSPTAYKDAIIRGEDGITKEKDMHSIIQECYKEEVPFRFIEIAVNTIDYNYKSEFAFEKLSSEIIGCNLGRVLNAAEENKEE